MTSNVNANLFLAASYDICRIGLRNLGDLDRIVHLNV